MPLFEASKPSPPKANAQKSHFLTAAKYEAAAERESSSKKARETISNQIESGATIGPLVWKKLEEEGLWLGKPPKNFTLDTGELSSKAPYNHVEMVRLEENILKKERKATILLIRNGEILISAPNWSPSPEAQYFLRNSSLSFSHLYKRRLEDPLLPHWPPALHNPTPLTEELEGEEAYLEGKDEAFKKCFRLICHENTLCAVNGPPGTGKTTLLAYAANYLSMHNKSLIIASTTNKAVETAIEKIATTWKELGLTPLKKIAKKVSANETLPKNLSKLGVEQIKSKDLKDPALFSTYCIVGCTMTSLVTSPPQCKADFIYFDEAGQIPAFQIAACAGIAKNEVVLGDASQLAPVLAADHTDIMDSAKSGMGLVQKRFPLRVETLLTNHRSNAETVEHTRETHYPEVELQAATNKNARLEGTEPLIEVNGEILRLPLKGTHFIDVEHSHRKKHCPEEAELAIEIIRSLLGKTKVLGKEEKSPLSIGDIAVLAPYRHQAQQIELLAKEFEKDGQSLLCGTVHKLQGQGKVVVIYSLSASNRHFLESTAEFLFDPHLINVATSRSIAACYILGNKEILSNIAPTTLAGLELLEKIKSKIEQIEVKSRRRKKSLEIP